jgi:hypothetical protein
VIARPATGSLSGGKRGFSRPGADHVAAEYHDLWGLVLARVWHRHPLEVIVMLEQMLSGTRRSILPAWLGGNSPDAR